MDFRNHITICVVAAVLVACGGGSDSTSSPNPTTTATTSTATASLTTTATTASSSVTTTATTTAPAPASSSAVDQATSFLAAIDASFASLPANGNARTGLFDNCFLGNGYTKALEAANFDADPQGYKYLVGSTRTALQVLDDRFSTNANGSARREIDVQYKVIYVDGTSELAKQTLISGSSSGTVMVGGAACANPSEGSTQRFLGNREVIDTRIRSFNVRRQRYSLATGASLATPVDYSKYVEFRVVDPSNVAKYVIVKGPGLPASGVKLVSPRIMRDDLLFAGKRGNYVDWKDNDSFRFCRVDASTGNVAADAADCVTYGASGNDYGSFDKVTGTVADSNFDSLGFVAGGVYTFAVHSDDGWKTANGQAGQTPFVIYTNTLANLPVSASAMAGSGPSADLFPRLNTSAVSPTNFAATIRSKAPNSVNLQWTPLIITDINNRFGWGGIYTFVSGQANSNNVAWPGSRQSKSSYPDAGAASFLNYSIPGSPPAMVKPTYAEFGIEMSNRKEQRIASIVTFE